MKRLSALFRRRPTVIVISDFHGNELQRIPVRPLPLWMRIRWALFSRWL